MCACLCACACTESLSALRAALAPSSKRTTDSEHTSPLSHAEFRLITVFICMTLQTLGQQHSTHGTCMQQQTYCMQGRPLPQFGSAEIPSPHIARGLSLARCAWHSSASFVGAYNKWHAGQAVRVLYLQCLHTGLQRFGVHVSFLACDVYLYIVFVCWSCAVMRLPPSSIACVVCACVCVYACRRCWGRKADPARFGQEETEEGWPRHHHSRHTRTLSSTVRVCGACVK